jgi:hypothetical protein
MKLFSLLFGLALFCAPAPAQETSYSKMGERFFGEISALGRVMISDTLRMTGLDAQYARFLNLSEFEITAGLTIFDVVQDSSKFVALRVGPGIQYNYSLIPRRLYAVPWVNLWVFYVEPAIQGYYALLAAEIGAGLRLIISQNGSVLVGGTVNKFTYIPGLVPSAELRFSVFFDRMIN